MTVQELIDELMKVKDKSTPVFYVHDISDYQLHREIIEKPYYMKILISMNLCIKNGIKFMVGIPTIKWFLALSL
mgnify:CR=1 FL=1